VLGADLGDVVVVLVEARGLDVEDHDAVERQRLDMDGLLPPPLAVGLDVDHVVGRGCVRVVGRRGRAAARRRVDRQAAGVIDPEPPGPAIGQAADDRLGEAEPVGAQRHRQLAGCQRAPLGERLAGVLDGRRQRCRRPVSRAGHLWLAGPRRWPDAGSRPFRTGSL